MTQVQNENDSLKVKIKQLQIQDSIQKAQVVVEEKEMPKPESESLTNGKSFSKPITRPDHKSTKPDSKIMGLQVLDKEKALHARAAFVFNLCNNIAHPVGDQVTNYEVIVWGNFALFQTIENYFKDKYIRGIPVSVHFATKAEELKDKQTLIISALKITAFRQLIKTRKLDRSLIITESEQRQDGCNCANLYEQDRKIKFDMNQFTLKKNGFRVNKALLLLEN